MRNSPSNLAVIVLAAGSGTRMKSRRAKVLHEMCGRSMLAHVLTTAEALEPERLTAIDAALARSTGNRCRCVTTAWTCRSFWSTSSESKIAVT